MAGINREIVREIRHFSHPHILELSTLEGGVAGEQYCGGCMKFVANESVYQCSPCKFYLHLSCAQISRQITHPADNHVLSLLSQPWAYERGICACNACKQEMRHGFSFHCSICQLDLHPSCANLPLKFNHQNHEEHTLTLYFISPYPNKAFVCDVCKNVGENCWHYHCSECSFDVHVTCTQISSVRESLLDQRSETHSQRLMGGHMPRSTGPSHLQQQRRPVALPSVKGRTVVKPVMESVLNNARGDGGGDTLDSIVDLFENIGSMLDF